MDELLIAVTLLRDAVVNQPVPVVNVESQDLSDIVQAVQGLAGPHSDLTATDIAEAVREVIAGSEPTEAEPEWVEKLLEALEKLDFRMKGMGGAGGVGGTVATISTISDVVRTKPEPGYSWPVTASDGTEVVADMSAYSDVFGALVTGSRHNQIEVHYDDAAWASYVTASTSGGGSATQHDGHVHFESGTGANGRSTATSLDSVRYRPMAEVYAAWTACWTTPGVANSYMRIGFGDTTNGAFVGYEGTSFGLTWRHGGVDTFVAQASWTDPLTGTAGSLFTLNGAAVAFDPTKTNIFRIRVGLLGSAPLIFEIVAPDGEWVEFYRIARPNADSEPTFTNFDLPMFVDVRKTGADATALEIRTACWAGGTTSNVARLSETITDRSLAQTVRAVLTGRPPGGSASTSYVPVTVNSSGRLLVSNDSVGTDGSAVPTSATAVGGTDGTNLQTLKVSTAGDLSVQDKFAGGEVLADQNGAGAVLTFTFASPVNLVWVVDTGAVTTNVCRADPFGGTPSATAGIPVFNQAPSPITVTTSSVKVYAPAGAVVAVHGYRY
jgi:hypothetical protein